MAESSTHGIGKIIFASGANSPLSCTANFSLFLRDDHLRIMKLLSEVTHSKINLYREGSCNKAPKRKQFQTARFIRATKEDSDLPAETTPPNPWVFGLKKNSL